MKIALFYATLKPYCTGAVLHRTLARMGHEVRAFDSIDPKWVGAAGLRDYDLYLEVHSSRHYHKLPIPQGPRAYWAIDTHVNYADELSIAKNNEFVFVPHVEGWTRMVKDLPEKAERIHLLPLAAYEENIYERGLLRTLDVAFVGHKRTQRRLFMRFVERNFKNGFYGTAYLDEMGKIYSTAKIGLNYSVANELNLRMFEVTGSGALLLSNVVPETRFLNALKPDEHYIEYKTLGKLRELVHYYLRHPKEREKIARAGQKLVLEKHTLRHRAKEILKAVKKG